MLNEYPISPSLYSRCYLGLRTSSTASPVSLSCDVNIKYYIKNLPGDARCQVCGVYADNIHTRWLCPRATHSSHHLQNNLSPHLVPTTWEGWSAPPKELQSTLWTLLINRIKAIAVQPEEDDHDRGFVLFTRTPPMPHLPL